MGKTVAANWKQIKGKPHLTATYDALAMRDKERYAKEMKEWTEKQKTAEALAAAATDDASVAHGGAAMSLPTTIRQGATSPLQVTDDDATNGADEEEDTFMDDGSFNTLDVWEAPAVEATMGMAALNLDTVEHVRKGGDIRQVGPHVVSPTMTNDTRKTPSAARATNMSFTSRMLRGDAHQVEGDLWGPLDPQDDMGDYPLFDLGFSMEDLDDMP